MNQIERLKQITEKYYRTPEEIEQMKQEQLKKLDEARDKAIRQLSLNNRQG